MTESTEANQKRTSTSELDLLGRTLGEYRVLRKLGRGAMSEVFLAEQQNLKRNVALKILLPELAKDPAYVRRFHREAQAAGGLAHASIVQIYDVGNVEGIHYIAQEYVRGQNLKQLLAKKGSLEVGLVFSITRQVAAALAKAAESGIVHRDIKPENILITAQREAKVADFGLVRVTSDAKDGPNLTQIGITMGTPLYMSPEQAEGKPLDTRSDIYSLGVTCYQLLAGRPPFEGDNPLTVAVKHLNTPAEPIDSVCGAIPPGFARIIHKMLAKKPGDRYQDAPELLRDLRDLQRSVGDESLGTDDADWSDAEIATLRGDSLRQLSQVMRTSALTVYRPPSWTRRIVQALLLGFVCLLVGGGLAIASRQPGLLSVSREQRAEVIPVWNTAKEQFEYALFKSQSETRNPELFAMVPRHFPLQDNDDNLIWGLKAMKQQAVLLLEQQQFRESLRVFEILAEQPEIQAEARAFGFAGMAICFHELGRTADAEQAAATASDQAYLGILERFDSEFYAQFLGVRNQLTGQT